LNKATATKEDHDNEMTGTFVQCTSFNHAIYTVESLCAFFQYLKALILPELSWEHFLSWYIKCAI